MILRRVKDDQLTPLARLARQQGLQLVLSLQLLSCSEEAEIDCVLLLLGKPSPVYLYPWDRISKRL